MVKSYRGINYTLIIIFNWLLCSCCSIKATKYEKQRWNDDISETYWYLEKPIFAKKITKLGIDFYIFTKEYNYSVSENLNRYEPTFEDIESVENLIDKEYKNNYNTRQYKGYYSKKGEKILRINFLSLKSVCQKKSIEAYLIDKVFLEISHADLDFYIKNTFILSQ